MTVQESGDVATADGAAPAAPAAERCTECGAPLAPDQRYCLACGAPRGPARVDLEALYAPAAPPPPAPPARPAPVPGPRPGPLGITPLGLVSVVAAASCAFLVGLVIGLVVNRDEPAPVAAQQPPPVVNVAVPTPAPALPAAATPEPTPESTDEEAPDPPKDAKKLDNEELEAQQNADPEQFQKQSKKLDKAATEGEPPPPDDQPPGGDSGDEAVTFE